jgi:hypothetical protein
MKFHGFTARGLKKTKQNAFSTAGPIFSPMAKTGAHEIPRVYRPWLEKN